MTSDDWFEDLRDQQEKAAVRAPTPKPRPRHDPLMPQRVLLRRILAQAGVFSNTQDTIVHDVFNSGFRVVTEEPDDLTAI